MDCFASLAMTAEIGALHQHINGGIAAAFFKSFRHSGRSVFGAIRNLEVVYIEIPGSRFQRAPE
jgi:hypothetical protein